MPDNTSWRAGALKRPLASCEIGPGAPTSQARTGKLGARGDQTSTMPEHIGNIARLSLKRDEDAHAQNFSRHTSRDTASICPPTRLITPEQRGIKLCRAARFHRSDSSEETGLNKFGCGRSFTFLLPLKPEL